MDLLENPFYILGATIRDSKHRILELADECRLLSDPDECMKAQSTLTRPQNRISAEIAWLPGVDPAHVNSLLKQLVSPHQRPPNIVDLPPLASANFLIVRFSRLTNIASINLLEWILAIADASESIDHEEVRVTLNEERNISGFPQITDLSVVTIEIQNRKSYYGEEITSVLNNLSVTERVRTLTSILETLTGHDNTRYPILIDELIEAYEVEIRDDLEKKQRIIEAQDKKLRAMVEAKNPDTVLQQIVNQLIEIIKDWDTIAQPIQLSKRSRGKRHTDSFEIAGQVRNLAVDLANEHQKYNIALQLLNMLLNVFAEVPEIVERIEKDKKDLEALIDEEKSFEKFKVVKTQVEKLKESADAKRPDYTLTPMVNQLIHTVKTWETSGQPFEANCTVALTVRDIALHLWNEHQKLNLAIEITNTLIGHFNGVNGMDEINRQLNEDKRALDDIKETEERRHEPVGIPSWLWKIIIFGILFLIGAISQNC